MRSIKKGFAAIGAMVLAGHAFGQTLQITQTTVTSEGAIQLHWQSQPNSLYQVQYMPDLSGNFQWQVLVDNYPTQGTNTLWLDTGDYLQAPPVNHPKSTQCAFTRWCALEQIRLHRRLSPSRLRRMGRYSPG